MGPLLMFENMSAISQIVLFADRNNPLIYTVQPVYEDTYEFE
jgi:hypothetical protein